MLVEELEQPPGAASPGQLGPAHPGDVCRVITCHDCTPDDMDEEVENDVVDILTHRFCDTHEITDPHFEAGLLVELSRQRFGEPFATLNLAARQGPTPGCGRIPAADDEEPTLWVPRNPTNTDDGTNNIIRPARRAAAGLPAGRLPLHDRAVIGFHRRLVPSARLPGLVVRGPPPPALSTLRA